MAVERSTELWTVGYFLCRCGERRPKRKGAGPPGRLGVDTWGEVSGLFYDSLGAGRDIAAFMNTLKNARDAFDGYFETGRVGWREPDENRVPQRLVSRARTVFDAWSGRSDEDLWQFVRQFIGAGGASPRATTVEPVDLASPPPRVPVTVLRVVRDTEKARQLKVTYRFCCQVCGLTIQTPDGGLYAEVHHVRPLGGEHQGLDVESNMLVLCPNHHAMFDYRIPRFLEPDLIAIGTVETRLISVHRLSDDAIAYHNQMADGHSP